MLNLAFWYNQGNHLGETLTVSHNLQQFVISGGNFDKSASVDNFQLILDARSKNLRDHCKKTKNFPARGTPNFIWIEKLNLLYLGIAKVGCRNWKALIRQVTIIAILKVSTLVMTCLDSD